MTRPRRLAAVVLALAAVVLATTAQNDAHAASAPTGARADLPHTTLHVHVTGCDRCSLSLQHAVDGAPSVWTSRAQRIGSDHVATFSVRTGRTHGLSFVLRAPWQDDTGAVPNMVTRYAGHRVDSAVTRSSARHAGRAEGCWAGTTMRSLTLDFHVSKVPARTLTGEPTYLPLAYATHTMSSWQPMVKTYQGTIANQDAFYCTRPPTTKVTFTAPGCDGCQVQVMNAARYDENFWGAPQKTVSGGSVTFGVPRPLTRGISATVVAPWEGTTGFTTLVAFRYGGHQVGDLVSFTDARSRDRATPCWAGTTQDASTIPLTVREVRVPGTTGPTNGTIAFARVTQPWLAPMLDTFKGIVGAQDQILCTK